MDRGGCPQWAAPLVLTTLLLSVPLRIFESANPNRTMNKEQLQQLVEFREKVRELRGYL